ncbi:uncharacterized protein LOC128333235 [Hemicordylus capensis]|uniref:uncharacterized protein LOC128333235 n=1 Tax=Hemicordylus capensis TaxID=884348 RepID=UPI00230471F6|nr:uncharacterized protein LOC128333235 [Hemicordylus capensis]XP_053124465.1 uncharacterized protein LOC128333235 [Hemicordylus capensis]XP_053124467.1 uncharacterized protein LOC128333235 [Hemicordylus capensis]
MAEKYPANHNSPERRPVLVSSHSSTSEPSPSGPSDLQPFSLGRVSSSTNLSSITVPVRLDVLYFLLTSAARGAQHALQPTPLQGGQGSFPACHVPATQYSLSCCGCPSSCHSVPGVATVVQQVSGAQQAIGVPQGRAHGGQNAGVMESRNNGPRWSSNGQRSDGNSWSRVNQNQPDSSGSWRRAQFSGGWQENPRREMGGGQGNWQGRRQNFSSPWGDQRQGMADSAPWKSGSQDRRREAPPLGPNASNRRRTQEGCHWQTPRDAPDAKRRPDSARMGWQKSQESPRFVGKTAAAGPVEKAPQESGEDWDMDYEREQAVPKAPEMASHASSRQVDTSKDAEIALPADAPKPRLMVSPPPEPPSKDQESATAREQPAVPRTDWSKSAGFVSYLKSLYSDPSGKSSSEGSTDLVIDLSKTEEEEPSLENAKQCLENAADGKMKSCE